MCQDIDAAFIIYICVTGDVLVLFWLCHAGFA
jgi:hypothetical protein